MRTATTCALLLVLLNTRAGRAASGPGSAGVKAVLDGRSPWRLRIGYLADRVRRSSGELQYAKVGRKRKLVDLKGDFSVRGGPPEAWRSLDFDDSGWGLCRPPLYARGVGSLALICLRGKFTVPDPGALKGRSLELSLAYRGGVVVFVNGKEIAREHMPKGKIVPETSAQDYPKEAYLTPEGWRLLSGFGHPAKYAKRFALRERRAQVRIPASALRKGTNVLALEVHRAPTAEVYYTARHKHNSRHSQWDRLSFDRVSLSVPAGSAVSPNVSCPAGTRVWNWPVYASVHTVDFGDPHRPLGAMEIVAARNGTFSGQVVVSSTAPIKGLSAKVSELKGAAGATLPAKAVEVRYPRPSGGPEWAVIRDRTRPPWAHQKKGVRRFDAVEKLPPAEISLAAVAGAAVQPVWVTVKVPADAPAGDYRGQLTVLAGGKKLAEVPVHLSVADWRVPDPNDYGTFVGLVQSPESVALRYKLPMWSKEHWKLLEKSFALLAQVGTKDVYVTARAKTFFGNQHSMIRWIRKPDGKWDHDFSIAEKYVGLAVKHLGKVPVVMVYAWDVDAGSTYFGRPVGDRIAHHIADPGTPFTVLDPKTGKLSEERSPKWNDPGAVAFWKPVYDGVRRILAKHGIEKSMVAGMCPDKRPVREVVKVLKEASGDAPWISHAHPTVTSIHGQPVSYCTVVWSASAPRPLSKGRRYGWKSRLMGFPRQATFECGWALRTHSSLTTYRAALEKSLIAGRRGIGRCGADFWSVVKDKRGRTSNLLGTLMAASWHGGNINNACTSVLAPGDNGPVATVRLEALRAGAQEAEARIFIERILTDPARKAKLGAELAAELQKVLDERFHRACGTVNLASWPSGGYLFARASENAEVAGSRKALFAAAAKAANKLAE